MFDLLAATRAAGRYPSGVTGYILGGAIAAKPADATAIPWRGDVVQLGQFQVPLTTPPSDADAALADSFVATWNAINAAANGGVAKNFYNFLWCGGRAQDDLFNAFFGGNAARLRAIKQAADTAGRLTTFCDVP